MVIREKIKMDLMALNLNHIGPPRPSSKEKIPQHEIIRQAFGFKKVTANPKRRKKMKKKKAR